MIRLPSNKKVIVILSALCCLLMVALNLYQKSRRTMDVILFMGQSNMSGANGDASQAPELIKGAGYEYRAITEPERLFVLEEPFGENEHREGALDDREILERRGTLVTSFVNAYYEETGTPVAALDLPSGVNGDTGEYESCIPADLTVAMGAVKPAHLVNWAGEYMKELALGEIGAHPRVEDAFSGWQEALELYHVRRFLPRRSHTGHKGQNGRLLLIAGCRQYPGAAVLATAAAARSGAGYVRLASIPGAVKIVAARCPEAIYTLCKKNSQGGIAGGEENLSLLLGAAQGADAIAIGCGMEPGPDTLALVKALLRQEKPLLLDAGALTALAVEPEPLSLLENAACPVVITPHPGEYARLTGVPVGNNPFSPEYTRTESIGITVLWKGYITGITGPEGKLWHFGGCDGLAKGGSGDVLTGLIGGLLAQGASPFGAAVAGAWLHGRAAQLCARDHTRRAMVPSQLMEYFGRAFLEAEQE